MRALSWLAPLALLAACGDKDPINPFDPEELADVPEWIGAELDPDACSSSPYWDDSSGALVATTYFAGNYEWDGDSLLGYEFWFLFPDPDLAATGFEPCQVVWDVRGTRTDPTLTATYGIAVTATVDETQTDCIEVNDQTVFTGEETFSITYDIQEVGGSDLSIFFPSGTQLGTGEFDRNGLSWISERDCKLF